MMRRYWFPFQLNMSRPTDLNGCKSVCVGWRFWVQFFTHQIPFCHLLAFLLHIWPVIQDLENFLPCLYRKHKPFDVKGEQCGILLINCAQGIPDSDVDPARVVVGSLYLSFASIFSENFDDFCILFSMAPISLISSESGSLNILSSYSLKVWVTHMWTSTVISLLKSLIIQGPCSLLSELHTGFCDKKFAI